MSSKILITGATGMLGSALVEKFRADYRLYLTASRPTTKFEGIPYYPVSCLDVNFKKIKEFCKPDIIINCSALTDHLACEKNPEQARKINALCVAELADVFPDAYIIQISTDAVFGSDVDFPDEDCVTNPDTIYGVTKLQGERLLLERHADSLVLRTTVVGLGGRRLTPSLAEWILSGLKCGDTLNLYTDALFCPVSIWDFANLIGWCLSVKPKGIFHAACPEIISKYDFGYNLALSCGLDTKRIKKAKLASVQDGITRRLSQALNSKKLEVLRGCSLPSADSCITSIVERYNEYY